MAGQIGEYISKTKITEWTSLEELSGVTFSSGSKYLIANNSGATIRFVATSESDPTYYGTNLGYGEEIMYSPDAGTLYVKGDNFNLAISEV